MEESKNREEKALDKISKIAYKLDSDLEKIKKMKQEESDKNHEMVVWMTEKKALHEIKKILHEVEHYEDFDEEVFAAEAAYMSTYLQEESYWNTLM